MIATPIGNLADITARAMKTIEECDELWCEDTRHTQNLLNALGIGAKRTRRVDQHITEKELSGLLERVEESGQRIGVVTDAGTPGLSDPGAKILGLISRFPKIRIEPIPGPSALTAFISISGFEENSFLFQGFFPRQSSDTDQWLSEIKNSTITRNWVFFESPNRITATIETLRDWSKNLDFIPKFIFSKELTKLHETHWIGYGAAFLEEMLHQHFDERGEWVGAIVLPKDCVKTKKLQTDWVVSMECLIEAGISTKTSAQIIAQRFGVAKNLAYEEALILQKKMKKVD